MIEVVNRFPAHPKLFERFKTSYQRNVRGGLSLTWRRRSVWLAQLYGRLGIFRTVHVPLFTGQKMEVLTSECVSRALIAFGYAEPTITALMLQTLEPGQCFVDVGTHFGYEALLACKLVESSGQVIAFEAHPETAQVARRNLDAYPQCTLHQMAVSSRAGTAKIGSSGPEQSAFAQVLSSDSDLFDVEAPMDTLDNVLKGRNRSIDFLKIDVEGHESKVLEGASEILKEDQPLIVLESDMPSAGKSSQRTHQLAELLRPHDYTPYSFDFNGELRFGPLDSFEIVHPNVAFLSPKQEQVLVELSASLH